MSLPPGFHAVPGTDVSRGQTVEIARRLDTLGKHLGLAIYGLSGYRSPAHSVAVGGFPNDPHTHAAAIDIGVGGQMRASASRLTSSQLASVGLVRPFPGAMEINHLQLKNGTIPPLAPTSSPVPSAQPGPGPATTTDTAAGGFFDQGKRSSIVNGLLTVTVIAAGAMLIYLGANMATGGAVGRAGKLAAVAVPK